MQNGSLVHILRTAGTCVLDLMSLFGGLLSGYLHVVEGLILCRRARGNSGCHIVCRAVLAVQVAYSLHMLDSCWNRKSNWSGLHAMMTSTGVVFQEGKVYLCKPYWDQPSKSHKCNHDKAVELTLLHQGKQSHDLVSSGRRHVGQVLEEASCHSFQRCFPVSKVIQRLWASP